MGKSNKFDYSNRPNSGAKLGAIIGRDVQKEVDKVVKDVGKQAMKARKASSGSSSSGLGNGEVVERVVHLLDIRAPSKQLGDEGACAMAEGMATALQKSINGAAVLLEDLNLSDNQITTTSLAKLSKVVQAACSSLKTLNLANNDIVVENEQQADEWEKFLRSFKDCSQLQQLDFSGNVSLGARALEIFAYVHCREPHLNPTPASGRPSAESSSRTTDYDEDETPTSATFQDGLASRASTQTRCGLCSIPQIILTNTGLNDAGALWLSYTFEEHQDPLQHRDASNSNMAAHPTTPAQTGLIWSAQEPTLGKDGLLLLQKMGAVRCHSLADGDTSKGVQYSEIQGLQRMRPGERRSSIRSSVSIAGSEQELSEVESVRKKIQRHIIANAGATRVELWTAALRVVVSSTVLSRLRQPQGKYYTGPPLFQWTSTQHAASSATTNGHCTSALPHSTVVIRHGTYAQSLSSGSNAASGEPELAITDATNSPTTPKMIFRAHRKGAFSDGSDLQAVSQKLDGLAVQDNSPRRWVSWQEDLIERRGGNIPYRDYTVPSQLPQPLVDRIASFTINKHARDLLTENQFRRACAWGQDRATFATAESWRRLPNSSQVLSLLENIGCLAYESG